MLLDGGLERRGRISTQGETQVIKSGKQRDTLPMPLYVGDEKMKLNEQRGQNSWALSVHGQLQARNLTLDKKIPPPLLRGPQTATFQSRALRSNHSAIPAPTGPNEKGTVPGSS